jgi:hypothetical protein
VPTCNPTRSVKRETGGNVHDQTGVDSPKSVESTLRTVILASHPERIRPWLMPSANERRGMRLTRAHAAGT